MTESLPAPPDAQRPRRPLYLTLSLGIVWIIGLGGSLDALSTIAILHDPGAAREMAQTAGNAVNAAMIEAIVLARARTAPLAAAGLVLSSVLALSASMTLFGRGRGRGLFAQAALAYGVFLAVQYGYLVPVRAAAAAAVPTFAATAPAGRELTSHDVGELARFMYWLWRTVLGAQLVALATAEFALTRPRVHAFFESVGAPPPGAAERP